MRLSVSLASSQMPGRTDMVLRYRINICGWFCIVFFVLALFGNGFLFGEDIYLRFLMSEPPDTDYYVRLGGYIHKAPWYFPKMVWPQGADKTATNRVHSGAGTPWLNFTEFAGQHMHGRMYRAGGVAEFPNVTVDFIANSTSDTRKVTIQIATAPDDGSIIKTLEESYNGSLTSFLISLDPVADAGDLETASQMTQRRLSWAREATGGKRFSPTNLIVQTSFWSPQRKELNLQEAEVLWLLGFNVVGNQMPEVQEAFDFRVPGHTHNVLRGLDSTREQVDDVIGKLAEKTKIKFEPGVPFGFSDEIVCGSIGTNAQAILHFRAWLAYRRITVEELGVSSLDAVVPIETPDQFRERQKENDKAARRIFYYTTMFRQDATTERLKWHTDAVHKYFGPEPLTSTLVADHPYFGGTGLGMGMIPNTTWGGAPLAADWFAIARDTAVDMAGIEDWMGLQYMYGPGSTWEGFQLMGFQAAIFRSGSRGNMPIMSWITPSDEINLRLKSMSSLCQGAKNFFYWTYGPTVTSTENYWSDLRSAYDGVACMTKHLAGAESVIAAGRMRKTRVALLYSISSDLWQPFDYIHMLERRLTYFSLIHDQYLVDMLTEDDLEAGRLDEYDVLYVTDPCIRTACYKPITKWVKSGGYIYGSCSAGSRNEFDEPVTGLSGVFGIEHSYETETQKGRYRYRGGLNDINYIDQVRIDGEQVMQFGAIATKARVKPTDGIIKGRFGDGAPAVIENRFGKGMSLYAATCPAISYGKDAKFVPAELKEKWPGIQRGFINSVASGQKVEKIVDLSHPVVEAGVYDSVAGTALVLANFTYEPMPDLKVKIHLPGKCTGVRSLERGQLKYSTSRRGWIPGSAHICEFSMALDLTDIVIFDLEK